MIVYQREKDEAARVPDGEVWVIPDPAFPLLRDYWKWEWEGPLIQRFLERMKPGEVLIDAGAHVGTWTLPFARAGYFVHAFEPSVLFSRCLRAAVVLNDCERSVSVHQRALGSAPGLVGLRVVAACGGCSSIAGPPTSLRPDHARPAFGTEQVVVQTLDSFEVGNVGLVKVDVEGHELALLQGAVRTLERCGWPPVVYECWMHDWFTEQRIAVEAFLAELGYRVQRLEGNWPPMFLAER